MENIPISIASYPKAIIHVDGDAFFTSVEQALDPSLRGRPVATGKERGIIACASYEAKARGIKRGVPLFQARKICPELVILPSDYEAYSLFSKRMFNIIRNYTPAVEEYSIDEAFADITGLRRVFRASYPDIAARIKSDIKAELNFTVSVGLSISKALAKLCSKFRKPDGLTAVEGKFIHILLQRTPLDKVWGFGPNTVSLLEKSGLSTACDFVLRPECWAEKLLHKPGRELWNELRGVSVWKVNPEEKATYGSIMKSKTFTPPSTDPSFVFAKLVRNVEDAFAKARRYRLRPRVIGIVLRHQDFRHAGLEATLSRPTSSTVEVMPLVREMFDQIFVKGAEYRATLAILARLENDSSRQYELFEDNIRIEKLERITRTVDEINSLFGHGAVCLATSLYLKDQPHEGREELPARLTSPVISRTISRHRLGIPVMRVRV